MYYICLYDVNVNGNKMIDEVFYILDCYFVEDFFFKVNSVGFGI